MVSKCCVIIYKKFEGKLYTMNQRSVCVNPKYLTKQGGATIPNSKTSQIIVTPGPNERTNE